MQVSSQGRIKCHASVGLNATQDRCYARTRRNPRRYIGKKDKTIARVESRLSSMLDEIVFISVQKQVPRQGRIKYHARVGLNAPLGQD